MRAILLLSMLTVSILGCSKPAASPASVSGVGRVSLSFANDRMKSEVSGPALAGFDPFSKVFMIYVFSKDAEPAVTCATYYAATKTVITTGSAMTLTVPDFPDAPGTYKATSLGFYAPEKAQLGYEGDLSGTSVQVQAYDGKTLTATIVGASPPATGASGTITATVCPRAKQP